MKTRATAIFATYAVATGVVFCASAGEDLATSAAYGSFRMDTSGKPIVVSSQTGIGELPRVTYRAGETVAANGPDGGSVVLVASAAPSAGTVAFVPTTGGLWQLVNSNGDTAFVGVGWSVFNDGWSLDLGSLSPFAMHTRGKGPNRRGRVNAFPTVSYSGDRWLGDSVAASTLIFTSPNGMVSSLNMTGTGTTPFSFDDTGQWTVRLDFADGTSREAEILVSAAFALRFQ